jgi:hypothetical protein
MSPIGPDAGREQANHVAVAKPTPSCTFVSFGVKEFRARQKVQPLPKSPQECGVYCEEV